MPNESLATFSIGQQLKAESLTPQVPKNWSQIPPIVPKLSAVAMQIDDSTSVPQEKAIKDATARNRVVIPPRFIVSSIPPSATLKTKQSWEGIVLHCTEEMFVARIADRTNPSNPEEIAEFESGEVTYDDRILIKPGASFYWTVGTEKTPAGQIKNVAFVNFRRSPRWSRRSLQKATNRARDIVAILGQE